MTFKHLGAFDALYLGVGGATGDSTNPLSVRGSGSLFDGNTGGHQVRVNKNAAGDTGGFLFQTGFSGRAEFGLLGNNDFTLKTSANGSAWNDSFAVAAGTGVLDFKVAPTLLGTDLRTNIPDNVFALADNADATKRAVFELSGITTGVTHTYTLPNLTGALATIGNLSQTFAGTTVFSAATVTVGTSTAAATYGVGTGATTTGNTKTVNLGTAGASGSTTVVNIGSATAGALGSLVVNSPTVTFASSVTAIGAAAANISALYLGLGGATADATNRLSINTPNVLLNNAGAGIDVTFNKNAAGNDASFSFKTGFTSYALLGLLGNNDFTLKVGSSFTTALVVAEATGRATFHQGVVLNPMASDLASPVDGLIWYNSTTGKFRGRQAGSTIDLVGAGGGGVTITEFSTTVVPVEKNFGRWEHEAVITAAGCTPSSKVQLSLAATSDTDENEAELLDVISMVAIPGTGSFTLKMTFGSPEVGVMKLNYWMV